MIPLPDALAKTPGAPSPLASSDVEDSSAVISLYQSERKIYALGVSGWFSHWRWGMVWATQLVFYGLPWLTLHGRPLLLFDLQAQRFYIFNLVFYPQDLIYLTGLLVMSALALFLFTAVAGRLWCGYACPQTVYTQIFMWFERRIEGDRAARMRLDQSAWTWPKLLRKGSKHMVWLAIALWTGFTFVGYFTPIRELASEFLHLGLGPWEIFWVLFYGFATYGNAGWMREQVCKYMCPYARFQSAMFDRDTLIVTYDQLRGEGRGSRPRSLSPADYRAKGLGDCIDCGLCVQVCPTGIDIRNGLQYECIGCAGCIDVCDGIMDKMRYPRGLIRNSTQNGVQQKLTRRQMFRRIVRPRVLVYGSILALVSSLMLYGLWTRPAFKVDVVRDRSLTAREVGHGQIENVYRLQIMNATEYAQTYQISVSGIEGAHIESQTTVDLDAASARWIAVRVRVPPGLERGLHHISFAFESQGTSNDKVIEKSVFLVPRS